jgi:hypothetical protein
VLYEDKPVHVKMIQYAASFLVVTSPKRMKEAQLIYGTSHKTEVSCLRHHIKGAHTEVLRQRSVIEHEQQSLTWYEAREEALKTRLELVAKRGKR